MPNVCRTAGADVLFLMDSSGSITAPNWRIMQDFVSTIIGQFPIGETAYKFAVDVFNSDAKSLIAFNSYTNISTLQRLVNVLPYVQGDTRTDLALDNAVRRSFTSASGVRDSAQGFPRVAIIITGFLLLPSYAMLQLRLLSLQMACRRSPREQKLPPISRRKRASLY